MYLMNTEIPCLVGGFTILWVFWSFLLYKDRQYSDALTMLKFTLAIWIIFLLGVVFYVCH